MRRYGWSCASGFVLAGVFAFSSATQFWFHELWWGVGFLLAMGLSIHIASTYLAWMDDETIGRRP